MAYKVADAYIYLTADDKQLTSDLAGIEQKTTGWTGRLGGSMKKVMGGLALGAVGVAAGAVAGLTGMIISGMDDAREAIEIQKQTEAVIKSTGAAAGMTAESVAGLATSLSQVTNFEDDAIQAGENLLLTFTNIGSEVFPQATETILDMSTALGQDMKSSAMQLGKALNDPIAGISALSRVGVNFTEEQKNLIKTMVEAGDVAGAQGIILQELGKEFGGSARALADPVTQFQNAWGNLKEELAKAVLPILTKLATAALPYVTKAIEMIPPVVARLSEFFNEKLMPAISKVVDIFQNYVIPAIKTVIGWFTGLGEGVQKQTDGPLAFLREWFEENMPRIQQIVETILRAITTFWNEHGETIMAVITNTFQVIFTIIDTTLRTIMDTVTFFLQILTGDWEGAGETLRGIVGRLWDAVKTIFSETLNSIAIIFTEFDWVGIGLSIMRGIANGISDGVSWIVDAAEDAARKAYDRARSFLGIGSPSKLAAENIGKPFAQGIAEGTRKELDRMTAGINSGLTDLMSGLAPQPAMAAANGPISITINVNGGGAGVGQQVRGGVLDALRQVGLR